MANWSSYSCVFVCGTRAVVVDAASWRVVCATCGTGGSVRHTAKDDACKAAVRDSARECRTCGVQS